MIVCKYNKFNDFVSIVNTIRCKNFLDKNKIYYNLSVLDKYKKLDYKKLVSDLEGEIKKYEEILDNQKYQVYLSKFGAFGSYKLPNKIYINIQRETDEIVKTILHEIVHLQIEEKVVEQGLKWEQKEKLVNSILEHYSIK
ncbi:hypothetical protein HON36_01720 [Candidatus Parcubacteria bacterium]|jgi:hypothetical protein|nr:hypothetical protein [Candidatus Parcubacteria bacterium]